MTPQFCTSCGAPVTGGARFCGACGQPLVSGLVRPNTISMALDKPPDVLVPGVKIDPNDPSYSDPSYSGVFPENVASAPKPVGVISKKRALFNLSAIALSIFAMGAVMMWIFFPPRGPAEEHAPVVISDVSEVPGEVPAPDELPEGEALERLVEEAVPAPEVLAQNNEETTPSPVEEAIEEVSPMHSRARNRTMRRRSTMSAAIDPFAPTRETSPVSSAMNTSSPRMTESPTAESGQPNRRTSPSSSESSGSSFTAATYGPAARGHVARNYATQVQSCFDEADQSVPGFSGMVMVSFMLHPSGRVASATVRRNTTGHSPLGTCLTSRATSWQLPPPPPRTLQFSMSFSR